MKSLTYTIGALAVGLALATAGCRGRGEVEKSRQTNGLDKVFMTSEGRVWATQKSNGRISQAYMGGSGDAEILTDLPSGSKPFYVQINYTDKALPFYEVHMANDESINVSSERVMRGKVSVEIDNVEIGGQK
ncbi:MAG: hypothetical protein WCI72_01065 [archaeon]